MAVPFEGILETALYVDDLDKAEAFYGSVLGLEKISRAATGMSSFAAAPVCF
jgi:catechol 2,3-dioxygenase-like lactoylglutathione lyase family enzyme